MRRGEVGGVGVERVRGEEKERRKRGEGGKVEREVVRGGKERGGKGCEKEKW